VNLNVSTLIVILAAGTIALVVYGLYLFLGRRKALLAERLETYAAIEEEAATAAAAELSKLSPVPRAFHTLFGKGIMQRIEDDLAGADIPMRATEYLLLRFLLAGIGFLVGFVGLGFPHSGLILAVAGYLVPAGGVRYYHHRRREKFVRQLADALMLLTNSLRSGYGFLKGLELVAKEMADPISKELNRTLREINLGATVEQGLMNLGRRVNSQDLDIVISAYLVQKDVGGNLTEIMEKVAETIRERLRIQGDIKVLTAQGRLSGLIVGLMPVVLFLIFITYMPDYFRPMFAAPYFPLGGVNVPMGVIMLALALCWQCLGGYPIFKVINIKV
jgi:tight adherence protein B